MILLSAALVLILGATGWFALSAERDLLRNEALLRGRSLLPAIETMTIYALETEQWAYLRHYLERLRTEEKDIQSVVILNRFGTPRLSVRRPDLPPDAYRRTYVRKLVHRNLARGRIELTVAPRETARSIQRITSLILLAVVDSVLFLGLVLHLALKHWVTRPLSRFLSFAERISAGRLDERIDLERPDEIGALAKAFDDMALSLARSHESLELANRELEGRVRRRSSEVEAILESLSDGLVVLDLDEKIRQLNPAACAQLDMRAEDLIGAPCSSVIRPLDAAEGSTPTGFGETVLERSDGSQFPVLLGRAPVRDGDGTLLGSVITFRDISRIQDLHMQIRRSDRLSSVGVLAAGVAHELNNPLANISTFTQLLQERGNEDPAFMDDALEKIRREVDRAGRIVRNLLDFSRPTPASRERLDPAELLASTLRILTPSLDSSSIEIVTNFPSPAPWIDGDRGQLQQVFINLLTNAVHAIDGEGRIELSISPDAVQRDGRSFVDLSVVDTGPGIDQADQARLFDPFFTTKDVGEGTGLGLSVSYGIVAEHGGLLEVDSETGRGTTFHVLLPWIGENPS